jgi:hypothetical protein
MYWLRFCLKVPEVSKSEPFPLIHEEDNHVQGFLSNLPAA